MTTTRTLLIEVQDDGITSVEEPTIEDVTTWLREHQTGPSMSVGEIAERLENGGAFLKAREREFARLEAEANDEEAQLIGATCTPEEAAARIAKAKVERARMMGGPDAAMAQAESELSRAIADGHVRPPEPPRPEPGGLYSSCRCAAPDFQQVGFVQKCANCRRFKQPEFAPELPRDPRLQPTGAFLESKERTLAELEKQMDRDVNRMMDVAVEGLCASPDSVPVYGAAGKVIGTATEEGRREGKLISQRALEIAQSRENEGAGFAGMRAGKVTTYSAMDLGQAIDERLGVGP